MKAKRKALRKKAAKKRVVKKAPARKSTRIPKKKHSNKEGIINTNGLP